MEQKKSKVLNIKDFTRRAKSIQWLLEDLESRKDEMEEVIVMIKKGDKTISMVYTGIKDPVWWAGTLSWTHLFFSDWIDQEMELVD